MLLLSVFVLGFLAGVYVGNDKFRKLTNDGIAKLLSNLRRKKSYMSDDDKIINLGALKAKLKRILSRPSASVSSTSSSNRQRWVPWVLLLIVMFSVFLFSSLRSSWAAIKKLDSRAEVLPKIEKRLDFLDVKDSELAGDIGKISNALDKAFGTLSQRYDSLAKYSEEVSVRAATDVRKSSDNAILSLRREIFSDRSEYITTTALTFGLDSLRKEFRAQLDVRQTPPYNDAELRNRLQTLENRYDSLKEKYDDLSGKMNSPQPPIYSQVIRDSFVYGESDTAYLTGSLWVGQTFTPAVTGIIDKVRMRFIRLDSSLYGNVKVGIKLASGDFPSGDFITSGLFPTSNISVGTSSVAEIDLQDVILSSATSYVLVVECPAAPEGKVGVRIASPGYAPGIMISNRETGGQWTRYPDRDILYELVGR